MTRRLRIRVATSRAFIAGRHKHADSRGGGLLIGEVVGCVGTRAIFGFTFAVADAYKCRRRRGRVQQIMQGDQTAERGIGVAAGGQLNGGAGSGSAGPFGIENGFPIVAGNDARILAIAGVNLREGAGSVAGEPERTAECIPIIRAVDICVLNDNDGLARSGDALGEKRVHLVDRREVGWDDRLVMLPPEAKA